MKAYLLASGTIFGLVGTMHLVMLIRQWRLATSDLSFATENGLLCAIALGLAAWAFRLSGAPER